MKSHGTDEMLRNLHVESPEILDPDELEIASGGNMLLVGAVVLVCFGLGVAAGYWANS